MQQIGFYCKTYCPLNMCQAPLCPSSGTQELYRWLLPVVHGTLVYRSLVWYGAVGYVSGLRDVARGMLLEQHPTTRTHNLQLIQLLMMGIMVPETFCADNKFCNKNQSVATSWPFVFHVAKV